MSFEWHWNSRKGISSKIEDPVNPENATEHAETRNESAIEHVKKPYGQGDIIPITEGDGESSRKKRPWDSKEEEESTMTFKRIRFEAIPEEARNNREVPDEMAKNAKKYFEKYVSDNWRTASHLIVQYQQTCQRQRIWMTTLLNYWRIKETRRRLPRMVLSGSNSQK